MYEIEVRHAWHVVHQMGTLGAGNHYAEIQVVDKIFDEGAARKMGIATPGQVRLSSSLLLTATKLGKPRRSLVAL